MLIHKQLSFNIFKRH